MRLLLAPMEGLLDDVLRAVLTRPGGYDYAVSEFARVSGTLLPDRFFRRIASELDRDSFTPSGTPVRVQLLGSDPECMAANAARLARLKPAGVDLNFGCPAPTVTKRGGGAALPYKRRLFGQIIAAAVAATEGTDIPVTVKFRVGIDDAHHTHLDAGRIAAEEGATAVALHARTASQRYSGTADWDQIAALKAHVTTIPVLGNGDIFEANDALAMMAATGCDGVVVGRGCLGRPWLFAELSAAFTGRPRPTPPTLGEVADIVRRHGELLSAHFGEDKGMRDIRKHVAWYLHGFPAGADLRRALALVKTLRELDGLLDQLDRDAPFPPAASGPRGRQGSAASVSLPEGWLNDPDDCAVPVGADVMHSGG